MSIIVVMVFATTTATTHEVATSPDIATATGTAHDITTATTANPSDANITITNIITTSDK